MDTTKSSHHGINFSNSTTEPRPQWFGIQLAKQQSWQEQRVFANHQLVRSSSSSTDTSTADNNNSATDDDDDDAEVTTDPKPSWQFSHLAGQFSKLEQECFANSFAKVKVSVRGSEEVGGRER